MQDQSAANQETSMIDELIERTLAVLEKNYPGTNLFGAELNTLVGGRFTSDPLFMINDEELLTRRISESQIKIPLTRRGLLRLWHFGNDQETTAFIESFRLSYKTDFMRMRAASTLRRKVFTRSLRLHLVGVVSFMTATRGQLRLASTIYGYAGQLARNWATESSADNAYVEYTAIPWLLLYMMNEMGIIHIRKILKNKKGKLVESHVIYLKEAFLSLIPELCSSRDNIRMVSLEPIPPAKGWFDGVSGKFVVARADKRRRELIQAAANLEDTISGQALLKLQQTPFAVNTTMVEIVRQLICIFDAGGETPLPFDTKKLDHTTKMLSRAALITTLNVAEAVQDSVFYTPVFMCFRGRKYKQVMSLNDQVNDPNKSLILMGDHPKLGEMGVYWLMIHAANTWGNDKAELDDRVEFTISHLDEWIEFAEDPFGNTGWFKADAPFSFLAVCLALRDLRDWVRAGHAEAEFRCGIIVYFDGSNNGLQHMAAMTRDPELGRLVNLTDAKGNQDAYSFVATHLWKEFEEAKSQIPPDEIEQLSVALEAFRSLYDDLSEQIKEATLEDTKPLRQERLALYSEMKESIKKFAPVHWIRIAPERKQRRSLVKRGVMTLGYGVTVGGMAQQVVDDFDEDAFERTELIMKDWFGRRLFSTCESVLSAVTVVRNCLATAAERNGSPVLQWTSPSGFPVVMYAFKTEEIDLELEDFKAGKLGGLRVTREVQTEEYKKSAAKNGISPNVVHSCDAGHLDMTAVRCQFPITTIHDSFGAAAGNADDLFYIVRETFVEMYMQRNVLGEILQELGHPDLMPEMGTLDLNQVMGNDFTFA